MNSSKNYFMFLHLHHLNMLLKLFVKLYVTRLVRMFFEKFKCIVLSHICYKYFPFEAVIRLLWCWNKKFKLWWDIPNPSLHLLRKRDNFDIYSKLCYQNEKGEEQKWEISFFISKILIFCTCMYKFFWQF